MSAAFTVINFSHPLTPTHVAQVAHLLSSAGEPAEVQVVDVAVQLALDQPLARQAEALVERARETAGGLDEALFNICVS